MSNQIDIQNAIAMLHAEGYKIEPPKVLVKYTQSDLDYEIEKAFNAARELSFGGAITGHLGRGLKYLDSNSYKQSLSSEKKYENNLKDSDTWTKMPYGEQLYPTPIPELRVNKLFETVRANKEVLFTTEDGVKITKDYDGEIWRVFIRISSFESWKPYNLGIPKCPDKDEKYFSTEGKAKEYVLINKPCLSVNDLMSEEVRADKIMFPFFIEDLKKLAQSKINKP